MAPDFSAGNPTAVTVPEDVLASVGYTLPEPHPPSAPTPSNVQGPHEVTSTEPPSSGAPDYEAPYPRIPGESPDDRTAPSPNPGDAPVPADRSPHGAPTTGSRPFTTENAQAVPVFERAASDFTAQTFVVSGPIRIVGRTPGRTSVTLAVPATDALGNAVNGIVFGETEGELQGDTPSGMAFLLAGMSVTIVTEAPVWVAPIPGGTSPGTVMAILTFNPAGGSLGAN